MGNWGYQDRSTFFVNPFRNKIVWSFRGGIGTSGQTDRVRLYGETTRILWGTPQMPGLDSLIDGHYWYNADTLDPRAMNWLGGTYPCGLYNLDCTPYESLMLGLFSVWSEPGSDPNTHDGRWDKINQVYLGFSYDGYYFHRPTDANNTHADLPGIPVRWQRLRRRPLVLV